MADLGLRSARRHATWMQLAVDMYWDIDGVPDRLLNDIVAAERDLDMAYLMEYNRTQVPGPRGASPEVSGR